MKLIIGLAFLLLGALLLRRLATRSERPIGPLQALIDFTTGAPLDSVLAIGAVIFGLIVTAAHFV